MLRSPYLTRLINGILFYFGWLFCVLSAAAGLPYLGLLGAAGVVAYHLWIAERKAQEILLIFLLTVVGFFVETGMIYYRILEFASPNPINPSYAPLWILGIYAMFATTINYSLFWLKPFLLVAAILGALGGMVSYSAAEALGAVTYVVPRGGSMMVVGTIWFILMPVFYLLNSKIKSFFIQNHLS